MSSSKLRTLSESEIESVAGGTINADLSTGKLIVSGSEGVGVTVTGLNGLLPGLGLPGTLRSIGGVLRL